MEGITNTGFIFELEKDRLDNYDLLEAMAEIDENPLIMPRVIKLLLGDDQAQELKDHVRDEKGLVSTEKLSSEIKDIFESTSELKN